MAHQRGHRRPGDLEVGAADLFIRHPTPHVAPRSELPSWLVTWERRRPRWAMELIAEFIGVFIYSWAGMGATSAFFTTAALGVAGYGSLLNIALAYGLAIALAVIIIGPTSGSHLSPAYTIAFATFKGFPWRKVPQYIIAQILGAFVAGLVVYWQYEQPLHEITLAIGAAGPAGHASIFTPTGPAGAIAIFATPGQKIGYLFLNEFVATLFIAIAVFSILDSSNSFVSPTTGPLLLGASYFVAIVAFAPGTLALNTARDLGGRFAVAVIWGRGAFPKSYTAVAALTNILATLVGAFIQLMFLSDANRPIINAPPSIAPSTHGGANGFPATATTNMQASEGSHMMENAHSEHTTSNMHVVNGGNAVEKRETGHFEH